MPIQSKRKKLFSFQLAVGIASLYGLASMAGPVTASPPSNIAREVVTHIERLRTITVAMDQKTQGKSKQDLNNAWAFFNANANAALPLLHDQLKIELKKPKPHPMLVLDVAHFLYKKGSPADKELAKQALFTLDTTAPVVHQNIDALFHFTHAVASDQDTRILAFIDKVFLSNSFPVAMPHNSFHLNESDACIYLYGVYGKEAETHLRGLLKRPNLVLKVVRILASIGSPASVEAVKNAMMAYKDYEIFAFGTTFMMRAGGPKGQEAMLDIEPKEFNTAVEQYYAKIHPSIKITSFELLRSKLGKMDSNALDEKQLKAKLQTIYDTYGTNPGVNARDILNSSASKEYLIDKLIEIRRRMFYKITPKAFEEIKLVNAMINALRYREK